MPPVKLHDVDADDIMRSLADQLRRKRLRHTDLFKNIDASGDGNVSADELRSALSNLGFQPSESEFSTLMLRFDASNSGNVNFQHFDRAMKLAERLPPKRAATHKKRGLSSEELEEFRQIFCLFKQLCWSRSGGDENVDLVQWDDSGSISAGDLEGLLDTVGLHLDTEEVENMIREMDIDGNGSIDFTEFCEAMAKKAQVDYPPEDIAQSFKTFAKSAPEGLIRISDLRRALQTYLHKDCADFDGVDELLAHYQDSFIKLPGNDQEYFNYQEYIDLMTPLGSSIE